MSLANRQAALVEKFSLISDPMERLSAVISRRPPVARPNPDERTDAFLVRGCVSRVWLAGEVAGGVCRYRIEADAAMVDGLAGLLAELFEGASAEEAAVFEPSLLADLGFDRILSPTRWRGLSEVARRLREIAAAG
jgi:cysteine desulfuration protein SufE